mmetsp:Transcript_34494/g.63754  ORF Transcript_34494/g.63754 Transcript_34494/m.63754 type:complete len:94 (-) Transcript_34494:1107-1388(-)
MQRRLSRSVSSSRAFPAAKTLRTKGNLRRFKNDPVKASRSPQAADLDNTAKDCNSVLAYSADHAEALQRRAETIEGQGADDREIRAVCDSPPN